MKVLKAYMRELGRGIFVLLLATILIYGFLIFSPGGKEAIVRVQQGEYNLASGYINWLERLVLHLDWGETKIGGKQPVLQQVFLKGKNSLLMIGIALVVSGICSALCIRLTRSLEHITGISTFTAALPYVISGLPAFIVGSYVIQNYPQLIYIETNSLWKYYITPGIILGIGDGFLSEMMRHTQEQLEKVKAEGYMLLARAKGADLWFHLRYELGLNLSQLVFSKFTMLISGTVILEYMFQLPGIGSLVFGAAENHDVNLLLGSLLVPVFVVIIFNLINKILWITVDPRLR